MSRDALTALLAHCDALYGITHGSGNARAKTRRLVRALLVERANAVARAVYPAYNAMVPAVRAAVLARPRRGSK